ncbi:LOW QUALITY PROTEIN: Integrase catalytic core protein [Phytophthora palmivora]|uniref:Integrase catalytic core protein n=1 Tax=Phytophthora palmivora TaxID=4796 RepID=A0A2P4XFT6_9STRA|nr:LOW QUALITY PROTEIN: Integrase catalytic core protein [Phytophthora palmivora]
MGHKYALAVVDNTTAYKWCFVIKSLKESQEGNGFAERAHQTIMGKVRCALIGSGMVAKWWPEALKYMTAVNNRMPTTRLKGKSPYEVLFRTKPAGIGRQIWGSTCYAHIPITKRTNRKLSERAIEYLSARDVKFGTTYTEGLISRSLPSEEINVNNENITEICDLRKRYREIDVSAPKMRSRVANEHKISVGSTETVGDVGQHVFVPPILRSCRIRRPNSRLRDYVVSINAVTISAKPLQIPRSIKEARKGLHAKQWENTLQIEYQALVANNTRDIVTLPKGRKRLGCHWVFDVKYHPDGTVERFKARLFVRGNTQTQGVDFNEIFSPVARYESLRLLLAIATIRDLHVHEMDVSTAFLNGSLFEGIYMQQPHGLGMCKLKKSLYGPKQAPRIWYALLSKFLVSVGFAGAKRSTVNGVTHIVLICVYVDDITIAASSMIFMQKVKAQLASRFTMKDLRDIHYILKVEIKRDRTNTILSMPQHKYIMDLLQKLEMTECRSEPTPQAKCVVLVKEERLTPEQISAQQFDYRVGSLMYLVRGTRPHIANAVRDLNKFLSCYNKSHYKAAQRILKYLKGTSTYGLIFDGKNKEVMYELYTDASFANANGNRKSVTVYVSIMADACITWISSRQSTVSLHTAQAELIAASEGIKESEWLWVLLEELAFKQTQPIVCWCDNKGANSIITDPAYHTSTKDIYTKGLYAREIHDKGRIVIPY